MHALRLKRRIYRLFHWNGLGTAAHAKWITVARALPCIYYRPLSRKSKSCKTRWTLALGLRPSGRDGRQRQKQRQQRTRKKKSSRLRLPTTTTGCLTTAAAKMRLLLPQAAKSSLSVRFWGRGDIKSEQKIVLNCQIRASKFWLRTKLCCLKSGWLQKTKVSGTQLKEHQEQFSKLTASSL